jgi:hypothetical protein
MDGQVEGTAKASKTFNFRVSVDAGEIADWLAVHSEAHG